MSQEPLFVNVPVGNPSKMPPPSMSFDPLNAVASVASSLIGASSARQQNKAAARQADLAYKRQKQFAQHGIKWRTQDMRRAGLNPILAASSGFSGAGSAPSVQQAPVVGESDSSARALQATAQALKLRTQKEAIKNIKQDTASKGSQEELNKKLAEKADADALQATTAAQLNRLQHEIRSAGDLSYAKLKKKLYESNTGEFGTALKHINPFNFGGGAYSTRVSK